MTLPSFLVIGAGRSGTTSLHRYLGQHPGVFVTEAKAPSHFYCCDGLPPIDDPLLRAAWTGSARMRTALRPYLPARLRDAGFRAITGDLVVPALDPALGAELARLFRNDTLRLQDMIGRDLSRWLNGASVATAP